MFPGPGAQVYYNEAGEPLGWDYPDRYDPNEWDDPYSDDAMRIPDDEPDDDD